MRNARYPMLLLAVCTLTGITYLNSGRNGARVVIKSNKRQKVTYGRMSGRGDGTVRFETLARLH